MTYATPLQAGSLNRVVELQSRPTTVDAYGQQSTTWTTVITARAAIEPLSGSEVIAAGALIGETLVNVTIRYRPGITPTMRVLYEGQVYDILYVLDDFMRHRKLTLLCKRGATRG
jgi:SPP1 family predicted phage head-tail adaptor